MQIKIEELLKLAVANKASDLHLSVNTIPKIRINGELIEVTSFRGIESSEMENLMMSILTEEQKLILKTERELDFSVATGEDRFRVNMYFQKGMLSAALRVVASTIPTFEELGLPSILEDIIKQKQGFVLVTGPTGHGKSTTVASAINKINNDRSCHIVTIEDPVEYVLKPNKSIISQRELGYDTNSFAKALKSVLRQDPNVVFVGEMRDLETISSTITVAETGHLVFSTLHTNSAAQTIDRIIDVFPDSIKSQIRIQLAEVITAVISQRLIPTVDNNRVAAFEILLANSAIKNIIREGKTFMIENVMQTSTDVGMINMEASLARLIKEGRITEEMGMSYSLRPLELQNKLRSIKVR